MTEQIHVLHDPAESADPDDCCHVDSRALGFGLNEREREQSLCLPIVLHERAYATLYALGVHGQGLNGRNHFDALCVDEVVFLDGGRFEFKRYYEGMIVHRVAIIIPLRDENGDMADLAAWHISTNTLALWSGRVAMLGAENVFAPRPGGPLIVHETVGDWLRAGRLGVFVIDAVRASPLLHQAAPLGVTREAFGCRLRATLTVPAPRILVADRSVRAAA